MSGHSHSRTYAPRTGDRKASAGEHCAAAYPVRRPTRPRRLTWVWATLFTNLVCIAAGTTFLWRYSLAHSAGSDEQASLQGGFLSVLSTASYAASEPQILRDGNHESSAPLLVVPPVPTENARTISQGSAAPGERIFLTYAEWLNVLAQEAAAIALSPPEHLAILAGDSISLWFPPHLLPGDRAWLNQGISGETSAGLLRRLSLFDQTEPDIIFLMIGINDLIQGLSTETVFANYELILTDLQEQHPQAQIVIQSVLPHAEEAATWEGRDRLLKISNADIRSLNTRLATLAEERAGVAYLDLYPAFADDQDRLRQELSTDGLHLNSQGYEAWQQLLLAFAQS